jgi:hypothetical protein
MTSDSDDALSWDGDEQNTPPASALPAGWNAVGKGSEGVGRVADDSVAAEDAAADPEESEPLSTAMLLVLGVVGGVYLLYSIGWVVGGLRLKPLANFFVADAMFLPWFVLAIAAPALWFLATWVLTRGRAAWIRICLLLLGVVLLVPWPFVTVGVIGS